MRVDRGGKKKSLNDRAYCCNIRAQTSYPDISKHGDRSCTTDCWHAYNLSKINDWDRYLPEKKNELRIPPCDFCLAVINKPRDIRVMLEFCRGKQGRPICSHMWSGVRMIDAPVEGGRGHRTPTRPRIRLLKKKIVDEVPAKVRQAFISETPRAEGRQCPLESKHVSQDGGRQSHHCLQVSHLSPLVFQLKSMNVS